MTKTDSEFALSEVPASHRINFWRMLVVMLGLTFFSASMWSGGTLGQGLSMLQFMGVVLAGNLILGAYTGALAFMAAKTGMSTHLLARYAFGEKGSFLPSFLLAFTQIGWFGVGTAMFAIPVHKVTGINTTLLIILVGLLMTGTAFFGMKALALISFTAVPLITILGSFSVFEAVDMVGGMQELLDYQPTNTIGLGAALTICIGSFISAGTLTPDFTRFCRTKRSAVRATLIAFFLGNTLMFVFGAVGAIATGESDISDVMFRQGLIVPAILILGLNIWTTNDNALYASGLGLSNITKWPKNKVVILNGVMGTIASMWLYHHFEGWLTLLGSALPSIGAIIMADFFIIHRGNYETLKHVQLKQVNGTALAAWGAGLVIASLAPGIPSLNALLGSAIVYVVGTKVIQHYKQHRKARTPIGKDDVINDY